MIEECSLAYYIVTDTAVERLQQQYDLCDISTIFPAIGAHIPQHQFKFPNKYPFIAVLRHILLLATLLSTVERK